MTNGHTITKWLLLASLDEMVIKGELQPESKLIAYEIAFKMLEINMYVTGIDQAVLGLLRFEVGSGNHQKGNSFPQKILEIFEIDQSLTLSQYSNVPDK